MDTPDDRERRGENRSLSRRAFVAGGAGAVFATLTPGAASAQNEAGNETETETVFTDAALPATAPTLDRDDYTGLFVQVVDRLSDADAVGVEACEFVGAGETVAGYEIRLIDRIEDDRQTVSSKLYAAENNDDVYPGKLFVVNRQRACTDDYVAVQLEQIGAGTIGSSTR